LYFSFAEKVRESKGTEEKRRQEKRQERKRIEEKRREDVLGLSTIPGRVIFNLSLL
jgi:hypothetical protein